MTQMTIRGLSPKTERKIRQMAEEKGISLNRVILQLIDEQGDDTVKKPAPAESLRKLAGGWNEEDAEAFMASIKSCEQIDEEMWG